MGQYIFYLTLVAVVLMSLRALKSPGIALSLLWALYAVEQFFQASHPFFIANGRFLNFAIVLTAVASLIFAFSDGKIKSLRLTDSHIWWMLLMFLVCLSTIWSIDPNSVGRIQAAAPYIFGFILIGPFCAYNDIQLNKAFKNCMVLGGLILTGIVFSGFGRRSIVIAYDSASRQEIEGNPLAIASFAGYVVVCCVFSIYAHKSNILLKGLKVGLVLLSLYVIVRSGSRGQLIGVVLACLFWLPVTMKVALQRSTIIPLVFAAIVFTASVYFIGNESDLLWRWKSERLQGDQIGRLQRAQQLILYTYQQGPLAWIAGVGSSASFVLVGGYPHFVPGEVLGEEGTAGAIFFFGFLITATLAGWRTINTDNLPASTRVNMGALMTIFTYQFTLCLKQGSLIGSTELFSLGLCVSLVALGAKQRVRKKQQHSQFPRPMAAVGR